jgi:hypothetical protein
VIYSSDLGDLKMSPLSRMSASRDNWKIKNSKKRKTINQLKRKISVFEAKVGVGAEEIQGLKILLEVNKPDNEPPSKDAAKEVQRLTEENRRQKDEIRRLQDENNKKKQEIEKLKEELDSKMACAAFSPISQSVRVLCVFLLVTCGLSFRSITKILQALIDLGVLPVRWVPHFTSVINWSLRFGISLLHQVGKVDGPWIAIMDTSIDIGVRKAVVILRVRLSALGDRGSAITLKDCQVIFVKILENCTGEAISECLEIAFSTAGRPIAILKDGGRDLKKGTTIYREENQCKASLWTIADLGHVIANALKAEFAKVLGFKRLLVLVYGGAKRLRQTNAAIFLPPKLRTKGRFQGISRLAEWAIWILDLMSVPGQVKEDSLVAALRKGFPKLPQLRALLEKFVLTCKVTNKLQSLLKNKGLNQKTYQLAILILGKLPDQSHTRMVVTEWLDQHLRLQCRLKIGQIPLLISSDALESLFGKLKSILGRSPVGELNRMTLLMPALCGEITPESIERGLRQTNHIDLLKIEKEMIPPTLLQQKKSTFSLLKQKHGVPKMLPMRMTG